MAVKKVSGTKEQKPVEPVDTAGVVAPVERRVVACNAQFITVDAGKLSKGLKTTFEGVAMVFDSIGLPVQLGLTMDLEDGVSDARAVSDEHSESDDPVAPAASAESTAPAVEKVAVKKKAKVDTKPEPVSEPTAVSETQEEAVSEESALAAEVAAEPEPEAPVAEPSAEVPDAKNTEAVSSITIDDITKIIVQKIRQNRNTNEKIAAILKTYGVAKVSELPVDKYEAFLTDLSAI